MQYITGAHGFIGTHLTNRLVSKEQVIIIPHDQISTAKLDPFTSFFFLSSYGNMASHTDEDAIFKANIEDLLSVLKQAKNIKFKSFVYISSSSVMLKTQTTYSRCKRAAEEILLAFMERHDVPICIIRPFSVTGVGEQREHLIPALLRAAQTGETVNFVPNSVHDFIDVEDVVDGIISLSENGARGIYQLGTGKGYPNKIVLEMVEQITGKKIKTNIVDSMRPYDNDNWVSNNFKARSFGWLPKKTLQDSIKEMYEGSK
jgi:nucleoside-diphosphate-sugar epimerase